MQCRKCHNEIPDESKFCLNCGASLVKEKRKALKRANGTERSMNKKFRELRTADFQTALEPHMKKTHATVSKYKQLITHLQGFRCACTSPYDEKGV